MSKYFYTYNITCLCGSLKDHYYLGQHTTDNLNDGYCGSGTILKKYYNKYGAIENVTYTKTIVDFYSNLTELNQAEYELIGDKYKTDPMCLNLRAGGDMRGVSEETRQKMRENSLGNSYHLGCKASEEARQKMSDAWTIERKQKFSERMKSTKGMRTAWNKGLIGYRKGCKRSEETRQKMRKPKSEIALQHMRECRPSEGPMKGKTWYYDEKLQKRVWIDKK